jgi:hypothetical protein
VEISLTIRRLLTLRLPVLKAVHAAVRVFIWVTKRVWGLLSWRTRWAPAVAAARGIQLKAVTVGEVNMENIIFTKIIRGQMSHPSLRFKKWPSLLAACTTNSNCHLCLHSRILLRKGLVLSSHLPLLRLPSLLVRGIFSNKILCMIAKWSKAVRMYASSLKINRSKFNQVCHKYL